MRAAVDSLKVASLDSGGMNRIPFGYLKAGEDLDAAIERICKPELSNSLIFIEPCKVSVEEDGDAEVNLLYYGLLNLNQYEQSGKESEDFTWSELSHIGKVDRDVLTTALVSLRSKIKHEPIGYYLLPEQFTLGDFRKVYEVILGHEVDRETFRKNMWKADCLIPLQGTVAKGTTQRRGLYQFNQQKFEDLKKRGFFLDI